MNLDRVKKIKYHDIIRALEDYRLSQGMPSVVSDKTILISLKISENLLKAFRTKCQNSGIKYQTQIKLLMKKWITEE